MGNEYEVSTDTTRFDRDRYHHWMSDLAYWAKGRARATSEAACDASLLFGAYRVGGEMVGCARVVTDGVTFAWLCDVFVEEGHRGRGLGKALMDAVMSHPGMSEMKRFTLATGDAHGLYRRYGFGPIGEPERWMIRLGANV
jgi:GNAT superfamily N-acetyltransferase